MSLILSSRICLNTVLKSVLGLMEIIFPSIRLDYGHVWFFPWITSSVDVSVQ